MNSTWMRNSWHHARWREFLDDSVKDIWPNIDLVQTGIGRIENGMVAYEGFFLPPTSGQYRFLMTCDDRCSFKISTSEPLNWEVREQLMYRDRAVSCGGRGKRLVGQNNIAGATLQLSVGGRARHE